MKKISLITGVSREMGLGFETAKQLSALGYEVIIAARDLLTVRALAARIGVAGMKLDVTNEVEVNHIAKEIEDEHGKLDVLINNAGGYYDQGGNLLNTESKFFHDALDLNLLGAWRMIKAFMPLIKQSQAGRIVNVSSGAGSFTDPMFGMSNNQGNVPVYAITKLALNGLTVKIANELKGTSIKINSVCPGFVATYPGTEQWGARPVADGAKGIVWAATLDNDGPTGGFFRDGKALSW